VIAMVELSPIAELLFFLEYFMLPLIPLVVGGVLFYFKPKHRVSIGILLICFGVLELLFVFNEFWYLYMAYAFFGLLTILLGVLSVLYPKMLSKPDRIKN